ncbi:MAG TPA: AI-2E family transporter [Patescibacteria group bacterium]|nr:AI-2E family transporter [Patescibacteria group bacterium]
MNKTILNYFFLSIFLISLYLFLKLFWPFLIPFVLGVILVAVFYPWFSAIEKYFKSPAIASLLTCCIIFLFVILPIGALIGLLSREALGLFLFARDTLQTENVETFFMENEWLQRNILTLESTFQLDLSPENIRHQLSEAGKTIGLFLFTQAKNLTTNIISIAFNFILLLFIIFYLFRDGKKILQRILDVSPLSDKQEAHIIRKFREVGSAVFWGNLVASILQGIAASAGFLIFGPRGSILLIGLAAAILSLVPAVGPLIVFIPGGLFLIATDHLFAGIGLIVYGVVISNILDNIVKPKMIENKIKIHPLLVFFSILGGVQVFGILGILYGPLIVTLFLTIIDIYKTDFSK